MDSREPCTKYLSTVVMQRHGSTSSGAVMTTAHWQMTAVLSQTLNPECDTHHPSLMEQYRCMALKVLSYRSPTQRMPGRTHPLENQPEQLHDTAINVEVEVFGVFCPKDLYNEVRRKLMETALDVVSLPGKLSNIEANGGMDQLTATLGELSSFEARRAGFVARDKKWQAKNRNALDRIKTLEDLIDGTEELSVSVLWPIWDPICVKYL
jgi:hypothetical protein